MSHDPLVDTVHDLRLDPEEGSRPWRLTTAIGWSAALAATVGGCWLVVLILTGLAWHSTDVNELAAGRLTTIGLLAGGGLTLGLLVGGSVTLLRTKSVRSRIGETLGVAIATGVAGGICPLVAAAMAAWLPPLASSTLVWTAGGAVIGIGGYAWERRPKSTGPTEVATADEPAEWSVAAAAGWAVAVGLLCGSVWLGQLIAYGAMPQRFHLGRLVAGHLFNTAGLFALAGGAIGLVVGTVSGTFFGRGRGLATGIKRGVGFANVAAIGGGLFPFVADATARWVAPEVSSAACWAVVGAVAGFLAYVLRRRASPSADADIVAATDDEFALAPTPIRSPAAPPPVLALAGVLPGDESETEPVEEPAAGLSGWDAGREELAGRQSGPRVEPAPRTTTGAIVRIGPVLLVSVGCLLAVGLSAPSPIGWAMLAIGLTGLAVAWALAGQERRIGELERRLGEVVHERDMAPDVRLEFPGAP